jgi:DNA-binding LacI/PurR family transcriptional regulator
MPPTLRDIAKACEMDISTVSRALRDDPKVKPASRERIQAMAQRLGYQPNLAARMLVAGKNHTFWLILPGLTNPIEQQPAQFAARELAPLGYDLLTALHHGDDAIFQRLANRLTQGVTDGAIIIPHGQEDPSILKPLLKRRYPLVLLDRGIDGLDAPLVTSDNAEASRQLVRRCHQAGCREFVVLHGDFNSVERERRQSACAELDRLGCRYHFREQFEHGTLPVFQETKVAVLSSAQGQIAETISRCPAAFEGVGEIVFAVYDAWIGAPSPAQTVFVAVQDFETMASRAVQSLLAMAEHTRWPASSITRVPLRDYLTIQVA